MFKKTQLTIFAAMVLSCSVSYGQVFTTIAPSSLGFGSGATVDGTFDISSQFGQSASTIELMVTNGNVSASGDLWTVAQGESANFRITSSNNSFPVDGFIQHGGVLGSQSAQSGTGVSDGFTAGAGQDWTLVSALDSDYDDTITGNTYSVTHIGTDSGNVETNSSAFRWQSDQSISAYTVFSSNSTELVNNYAIGFRPSNAAVPEPSAAVLIAFASTLFLVRRKRN